MSNCVVPTCNNSSRDRGNNRQFHSFPRKEDVRQKWCNFVGGSFVPKSYSRICSDHFEPNAYTLMSQLLNLESRQKRLKSDAVPVLLGGKVVGQNIRDIRKKKREDRATVVELLKEYDRKAAETEMALAKDRQRKRDDKNQTM